MNKIGKLFISLGILLIIASASITLINNYEDKTAGKNSSNVLKSIKKSIDETTTDNQIENIDKEVKEVEDVKSIKIDGNNYIGIITIPSLNIELPIMSTYDEEKLKIAPCLYYGTISNNLIICAHSYKSHFGYLSKLNQSDTIIITDINGENYIYEVLEIEVLNSDDISQMIDNDFDLTLYTCTNDGTKRITVRANKINNKI